MTMISFDARNRQVKKRERGGGEEREEGKQKASSFSSSLFSSQLSSASISLKVLPSYRPCPSHLGNLSRQQNRSSLWGWEEEEDEEKEKLHLLIILEQRQSERTWFLFFIFFFLSLSTAPSFSWRSLVPTEMPLLVGGMKRNELLAPHYNAV